MDMKLNFEKGLNEKLIQQAKDTGILDKQALFENNMLLATRIVNKNLYRLKTDDSISEDDLEQVAMTGLWKAVNDFNLDAQNTFSSYATAKIQGEIKMYFRDNSLIKTSRDTKSLFNKIFAIETANPEITISELSQQLNISEDEINEAKKLFLGSISLNQQVNHATGGSDIILLEDIVSDDTTNYNKIDSYLDLYDGIASLDKKLADVVELRYFQEKSQMETADILGVSQCQVSRLERKAMQELKKLLQ